MRSLLLPLLIAGTCLSLAQSSYAQEVPLSPADKQHLLKDDFRLIYKVKDMPPSIQHFFPGPARKGSFGAIRNWIFHYDDTEDRHFVKQLANPGEPFQAGCIGKPGVPSRRLILAGTSKDYCFVEYECGGVAHEYIVLLFKFNWGRPELLWTGSGSPFADIDALRKLLRQNRIYNSERMIR